MAFGERKCLQYHMLLRNESFLNFSQKNVFMIGMVCFLHVMDFIAFFLYFAYQAREGYVKLSGGSRGFSFIKIKFMI